MEVGLWYMAEHGGGFMVYDFTWRLVCGLQMNKKTSLADLGMRSL